MEFALVEKNEFKYSAIDSKSVGELPSLSIQCGMLLLFVLRLRREEGGGKIFFSD